MLSLMISIMMVLALTIFALPVAHSKLSLPYIWETASPESTFIEFIGRRASQASYCDLRRATLPTGSKTLLPIPDSRLTLSHVAIGRGTQNYTCDLSNATALPVAIGAVASLYNVSCIAASLPGLLQHIPAIALDLPTPHSDDPNSPANADLSGHHYFLDKSTPFFNLNTNSHSYGTGAFEKGSSSSAPTDAIKGPQGKGQGAVAWLLLAAKEPTGQVLQEVYRVNTAGGNPPDSCQGAGANIEVPYSAEYWVYT